MFSIFKGLRSSRCGPGRLPRKDDKISTGPKIPRARLVCTRSFELGDLDGSGSDGCRCQHRDGCSCGGCTNKESESLFHLHVWAFHLSGLYINWVSPFSYGKRSGFRPGDRIVAVNNVFGTGNELIEEMRSSHADTEPVKHDTWKFLVMDDKCYKYHINNRKHNYKQNILENRNTNPYVKRQYRAHEKSLQVLCCDYLKANYSVEQIYKIFGHLNIPTIIQDAIMDAYNFYYPNRALAKRLAHTPNHTSEDIQKWLIPDREEQRRETEFHNICYCAYK